MFYRHFALAQDSPLVHATETGDELHVINLGTGKSTSRKFDHFYSFAFMYGSGEKLFIGFEWTKSAEILEGPRLEDLMPTTLWGVATEAGRTFVIRNYLSRKLYYANAGGPFDSLDLGPMLQDTVAGMQQIVAHGGYLFIQMSGQTYPVYKDTAYIAVLNTTTFVLEKTMALTFSSYNSTSIHPRVAHGKWYLCGSRNFNPWLFHGVDLLDLNTRALEKPLNLMGSNNPEGFRDFVAITPHSGYVIERKETEQIKKVTF